MERRVRSRWFIAASLTVLILGATAQGAPRTVLAELFDGGN
jgi:hypothetical protein